MIHKCIDDYEVPDNQWSSNIGECVNEYDYISAPPSKLKASQVLYKTNDAAKKVAY